MHASIGVLGVVSVATACLLPGTSAGVVTVVPAGQRKALSVEHPSDETSAVLTVDYGGAVVAAAILWTARKLTDARIRIRIKLRLDMPSTSK